MHLPFFQDLVASLELYILHTAPYSGALTVFDHSLIILALSNAGVRLTMSHVQPILEKQTENGDFTLGTGEYKLHKI